MGAPTPTSRGSRYLAQHPLLIRANYRSSTSRSCRTGCANWRPPILASQASGAHPGFGSIYVEQPIGNALPDLAAVSRPCRDRNAGAHPANRDRTRSHRADPTSVAPLASSRCGAQPAAPHSSLCTDAFRSRPFISHGSIPGPQYLRGHRASDERAHSRHRHFTSIARPLRGAACEQSPGSHDNGGVTSYRDPTFRLSCVQ